MLNSVVNLHEASRHSPMRAGDVAFRMFCRPNISPHASPLQNALAAKARGHLGKARWFQVPSSVGRLQAYDFGPAKPSRGTVLLVHGWTSEAAFMTAFVEPLRQRGHRVLAFDFPAHGHSGGRETTMIDCARSLLAVIDAIGKVDAIVAHSMGALVSFLVSEGGPPMPRAYKLPKLVTIASPNRLSHVTDEFSQHLGLDPRGKKAFERHIERIGKRPLQSYVASELLKRTGTPTLLIHSRDDSQVPFSSATEIAAACPSARLQPVDGVGHRMILCSPPVMRHVRDFLD